METSATPDLIDNYVNKTMGLAERSEFENRISADPALAGLVAEVQAIAIAVREWNRGEKKTMLAAHEKTLHKSGRRFLFTPVFKSLTAVAATLLIVVTGWLMLKSGFDDALPPSLATRSGASSGDNIRMAKGTVLYGEKNWAEAAAFFSQVSAADSTLFAESRYYLGLCQLAQSQFPEARASFDLANFPAGSDKAVAVQFYTGVACYKAGDMPCARAQFESVVKSNNRDYKDRAAANLKYIK